MTFCPYLTEKSVRRTFFRLAHDHNIQLIEAADHVIDLGPEGGDGGGEVVATGTPEDVAANPRSITGRYLLAAKNPASEVA